MGWQREVEQLVETHASALYRYAYRLAGNPADAEDLLQETFCKAQLQLAQLRDPLKARGWLFRILRNEFLQRLRSEPPPCISLDALGDLAGPAPDLTPDIDSDQLQKALAELPEPYRTPVILFYFEEFGYREIAEQMGVPIGTVMSRLARAKSHLRRRLAPSDQPVTTAREG